MKGFREILVISGKGGTGKTTLSSSFALLPPRKVVVDADVDAPDLHIILKPQVVEAQRFMGGKVAKIDADKCDGCGLCRELCRYDAISPEFKVDSLACEGCALCYFACPNEAVVLEDREAGMWFLSNSRAGPMTHARLYPGEENSGKLVTVVRNRAKELAQDEGYDLILIDGPPGIGCPVLSSITGVDQVLVVTEPTPAGQHDLGRVVELAAHFQARVQVCINQWDISPERTGEIEEWCRQMGVEVVGKLPFSRDVPQLQNQGKAPVEGDGEVATLIEEIWEKMLEVE
ncbi:MAG: (4Fe-4S)-binding protein [Aquificota bacterium]|nr:MAG: (4Fe-4S)-binding protein [Aquificota bacterium]